MDLDARVPRGSTEHARPLLLSVVASRMRANLRRRAVTLKLVQPGQALVGFHAFRRGRAREEYRAGTPISRILELGGWKTNAKNT